MLLNSINRMIMAMKMQCLYAKKLKFYKLLKCMSCVKNMTKLLYLRVFLLRCYIYAVNGDRMRGSRLCQKF